MSPISHQQGGFDSGTPTYDAAGNITNDLQNQYLYDAEGRVCAVMGPMIAGVSVKTGYLYDAEGNRVGKGTLSSWSCNTDPSNFTLTNEYVLGQGGEQITELDGSNANGGSGNWLHTNAFAGGQLIATYDTANGGTYAGPALHYQLADWLGTRRMQVSPTGAVEETCQSLPFGDQLTCVQTNVATADDATEHHFTGKERDTESGLDYFGARYYSSSMGRFMSPDWAAKPDPVPYADLNNPQTLNLYSYGRNNPLSNRDIDGHSPEWWQKFWNWVGGNGLRTDQQVADSHRAYLLEHMKDSQNQKAVDNIRNAPNAAVNQAYQCVTHGCALLNAIQIPTVGGKPFQTDQTGKIHTDIPDHVPENWNTQQLEDAKGELEESIKTRKDTLDYNEPDAPGHQTRLQNEQRFLDQVNEKLAGGK